MSQQFYPTINILLQDQRQSQARQVMSFHFWRIFCCLREIWYEFCLVFVVRCYVALLLSSTMLRAGLVMSCIVASVWRPCFLRVLLTVCHVLLLPPSTMLRAGVVDSMSCTVVIM